MSGRSIGVLAAAVAAVLVSAAALLVVVGRFGDGPAQAWPVRAGAALPTLTASPSTAEGADAADAARSLPADRCARFTGRGVLVDLSEQHLWTCRSGATVAHSPVTTGSDEHPTPTGRWDVYARQTDRWLSGEGYSRLVEHWVPFSGGYGFHDSAWQRIPYGSDRVHARGSHGCVHVPAAFMARLYRWIEVGTPVRVVA